MLPSYSDLTTNDELTLSCFVDDNSSIAGNPPEYTFIWFMNFDNEINGTTDQNLTITIEDEGDDGVYYCCASNEVGSGTCGRSTVNVRSKYTIEL